MLEWNRHFVHGPLIRDERYSAPFRHHAGTPHAMRHGVALGKSLLSTVLETPSTIEYQKKAWFQRLQPNFYLSCLPFILLRDCLTVT